MKLKKFLPTNLTFALLPKGGKIEIEYSSLDEFDRLLALLMA